MDPMASDSLIKELMELERPWWAQIRAGIPSWHPRADGEGDGDAGDGDDAGGDGGGDGDRGDDKKDSKDEAVAKAYEKLRTAEKERDKLAADIKRRDREGMKESEKLKAELDDARLETAALAERLDKAEREKDVIRIARALKFKNPDKAVRFVGASSKTEREIRADLREALDDIPELAGAAKPRVPVNDDKNNQNSGAINARMNEAIRAAAGRGAISS